MAKSIPFGVRATADQVLAGIDLTGKRFAVTGCNSGLGFETMSALAANGAQVIGLARSLERAEPACRKAGPLCNPVACDLADLDSVAAAADTLRSLQDPLDAIVANAGIAYLPTLQTRYGVEMQFLVNHVGHFALLSGLLDLVRSGTGRIVIVSGNAGIEHAPPDGIMFNNLDGGRFYKPATFYGQSKLANALFAKELSRRVGSRGIAVNSVHPGATHSTGLYENLSLMPKLALSAAGRLFMRPAQRGAATQTLLAANPAVAGISGEYWSNCRIAAGSHLLQDAELAARLWRVSEQVIAQHASLPAWLRQAA
jgi:WW domain-containing oxidoreductase